MLGCAIRMLLGCAIPVATLFSVFGFLCSFASAELSLLGRLGIGAMTGGTVSVACILLLLKDRAVFSATRKRVRNRMMARDDVADQDFCRALPGDESLLLDVRQALADFFAVPTAKIHPTDNLQDDYQYRSFEPSLHMFAISRVLTTRGRSIGSFKFPEHPMKDVGDFAKEIHRIVAASFPAS